LLGTSGEVEPVRSFPKIGKKHGAIIIEINPEKTFWTHKKITDYFIPEKAENVIDYILSTDK
jgi:NAD-dependent deacetylase